MTVPQVTSSYYTTSSGTKTHFLRAGKPSGSLFICLHGLGGSTETFIPLLPFLPQNYNIVLVDFQGCGKTPLNDSKKQLSITGHVTDLDNLISHLETPATNKRPEESGVTILGHSLGAIVALQYAAQFPHRVKGLILLGAGRAAGHIPAARKRMLDLAATVRKEGMGPAADIAVKSNFYDDTTERIVDPAAREAVRRAVGASDAESYAKTCEAVVDLEHIDPDYENIAAPCVFIAGDKDAISPVARSRDLSALIGENSWVEVVRSGHQPILEDISGVRNAVDRLLGFVSLKSNWDLRWSEQ